MDRRDFLGLPLLVAPPIATADMMDWFNGVSLGEVVTLPELLYLGQRPRTNGYLTMWYFWATWCEACRDTFALLNDWHRNKQSLEIVAITDEDAAKVRPFIAKVSADIPIALDAEHQLFGSLHIRAIPYAILLNRKSVVIWRGQPKDLKDTSLQDMLEKAAVAAF